MSNIDFLLWVVFISVFFTVLFLDLFVFFRRTKEIDVKKALLLSASWISIALLYSILIFYFKGGKLGIQYITAYLVELSLSVDNLFVFLVIFAFFAVPKEYQHKVLFWGVIGAIIFRGIFIFLGVELVSRFSWLFIVFGLFLVYTALMLIFKKEDGEKIEKRFAYKLATKIFRITPNYIGDKFFTKIDGKLWATPLFLCLILVEVTDVMFAVDSIPAVLGISTNVLIVYTSNIFAVMGLRSMYFALAGIMGMFRFLKYGLSVILAYIGSKMILKETLHIHIDSFISFSIIVSILVVSIALSIIIKNDKRVTEN
ncbi:MAG: TerC family protein [Brevinematales bacterium]|nr:TerC family protein [Brevinematales bacterium]